MKKGIIIIIGVLLMTQLISGQLASSFTKDDYIKLNNSKMTGVSYWDLNNPEQKQLSFYELRNKTINSKTGLSPLDFAFTTRKGGIKKTSFLIETKVNVPNMVYGYNGSTYDIIVSNLVVNKNNIEYDLMGEHHIVNKNNPDLNNWNLRKSIITGNLKTRFQNGTKLETKRIPLDSKTMNLPIGKRSRLIVQITPEIKKINNGWGYSISYNPWYNATFLKRINVTMNNSRSAENLTNYPLLIVLNSSIIDYADTQNNGEDIRFTDSDESTLLDYEIDVWNESGNSYVWVRVPKVNTGSTDFIQMYYDCSTCTDNQNPAGVWNDYLSVYHFSEDPSTSNFIDSTGRDNLVPQGSMTSSDRIGMRVGYGADFDGLNDGAISGLDISPDLGTELTTLQLIYNEPNTISSGSRFAVMGWRNGISPIHEMRLTNFNTGTQQNGHDLLSVWNDPALVIGQWVAANTFTSSSTTNFDIVYNVSSGGNNPKIVVNGTDETLDFDGGEPNTGDSFTNTASRFTVAIRQDGTNSQRLQADEVRLRNSTLSVDWLEADYYNSLNQFNTYGNVENAPSNVSNTCTYGGSGDWLIDMTDNCIITTDYNINGRINFTGNSGTANFSKIINTTNLDNPPNNTILYIGQNNLLRLTG